MAYLFYQLIQFNLIYNYKNRIMAKYKNTTKLPVGATFERIETLSPEFIEDAIKKANENGFVINLSSDNLEIADANMALNIAPVVVLLPINAPKVSYTPNGHKVVACHADSTEKVKCANCKLCALPKRDYIIGFRAHGVRKNKVAKIALNDIS